MAPALNRGGPMKGPRCAVATIPAVAGRLLAVTGAAAVTYDAIGLAKVLRIGSRVAPGFFLNVVNKTRD